MFMNQIFRGVRGYVRLLLFVGVCVMELLVVGEELKIVLCWLLIVVVYLYAL